MEPLFVLILIAIILIGIGLNLLERPLPKVDNTSKKERDTVDKPKHLHRYVKEGLEERIRRRVRLARE